MKSATHSIAAILWAPLALRAIPPGGSEPSFGRPRGGLCLFALSLGAAAIFGTATQAQTPETHHTEVNVDSIKWGPAPPSLPPGAQAAVLMGSPSKEGPFVLRLKFPAGFTVPSHRHSKDETVTLIAGRVAIGAGETIDRPSLKPLPALSFVHLPAGMAHYAWAEVESIVQINGVGPFDITYINPKDDPRQQ